MNRIRVLTITDCYLPGYKAGGPIRTLANMVDRLGDDFQFKIITSDRDFKDDAVYSDIKVDEWNRLGKAAEVFYMSPKKRSLRDFKRLFRSTGHEVIYLNSFFSSHFTIKPLLLRRMRLIPDKPLVIAPRGEFSPGALGLKNFKKRAYLLVAKALGLYNGIVWQASSENEEVDIKRWFGRKMQVVCAPNLPPVDNAAGESAVERNKAKGCLKIISLSRISRKKNLDGALDMLKGLRGRVQFNIYGPMEDSTYWAVCQKLISSLSENIEVRYCGSVAHDQVGTVMMEHDLFFLPTLGENFGHVILEALCAGCPVLISDQTPWRDLEEKGVGWDLPVERIEMFREVLQRCVDMNDEVYVKWSERAWAYGLGVSRNDETVEQNRHLFFHAVGMMNNHGWEKYSV
jgi:glycosyltransferase involved in cell wall biosynthesis